MTLVLYRMFLYNLKIIYNIAKVILLKNIKFKFIDKLILNIKLFFKILDPALFNPVNFNLSQIQSLLINVILFFGTKPK